MDVKKKKVICNKRWKKGKKQLAFIIRSPAGRKVIVQDNWITVDPMFTYKHNERS